MAAGLRASNRAAKGLVMFTVLLMGLLSMSRPAQAELRPHLKGLVAEATPAKGVSKKAKPSSPDAGSAPASQADGGTAASKAPEAKSPSTKPEAKAGVPMDPAVKKVVDAMQAFYEKTSDFEAHFDQSYTYASFHRTQKSAGKVVFMKPALMRWDYEQPSPKTIVVAGGNVYMYDPEAQQMTKASLQMEKLSASVTFLWGKGKLAEEFYISRATRPDLKSGTALELIPKKPDPRFDRVFMLVDPKTNAVSETIVVDPDGSENHMVFSQVKVDQHIGADRFHFEPPAGTQVIDMTKGGP